MLESGSYDRLILQSSKNECVSSRSEAGREPPAPRRQGPRPPAQAVPPQEGPEGPRQRPLLPPGMNCIKMGLPGKLILRRGLTASRYPVSYPKFLPKDSPIIRQALPILIWLRKILPFALIFHIFCQK